MSDKNDACTICAAESLGIPKEDVLEQMIIWEEEQILKYGWYIHYVPGADTIGDHEYINAHTHGLAQDFQIVYLMPPKQAAQCLHAIVDYTKEHGALEAGVRYPDILAIPVYFVIAHEVDRQVLRMIAPDPQGYFPEDPECAEEHKRVLEVKT